MTASTPVTSMRGWLASFCASAMRCSSGRRPRVSFSGFPGVTSHHMRSSFSRFMASRLAARCAACGGSKVPPNRPIRIPGACGGRTRRGGCITCAKETVERWARPDLPGAAHAVFEAGELFDADRAASVQLAGGDADLGTETELTAIGELRRGIVQHDRRIDLVEEFLRRCLVGGDNRVGMVGAVAFDVLNRRVDPVNHTGGDDLFEVFGRPVLFPGRVYACVSPLHGRLPAHPPPRAEPHG